MFVLVGSELDLFVMWLVSVQVGADCGCTDLLAHVVEELRRVEHFAVSHLVSLIVR